MFLILRNQKTHKIGFIIVFTYIIIMSLYLIIGENWHNDDLKETRVAFLGIEVFLLFFFFVELLLGVISLGISYFESLFTLLITILQNLVLIVACIELGFDQNGELKDLRGSFLMLRIILCHFKIKEYSKRKEIVRIMTTEFGYNL